jgi:hypothetical protein
VESTTLKLGGNRNVNPVKQKPHAVPQIVVIITPVNPVKEI